MTKFPFKTIDLTHPLDMSIPSWNKGCGFERKVKLDYNDCQSEVKFRVQQLKMHAGIGTHMDAPSHCVAGGLSIDLIALDKLISPLLVIDTHEKVAENYKVSIKDIYSFEDRYGKIAQNCFVAFHTGWSKYWHEADKYHNDFLFPSISQEVAELLLKRNVVGLGIDTLSPDLPSSGFPVHDIILGAGRYIVENIANLEKMPKVGAYVMALPIKGVGLTEAPIRMIGLINNLSFV